ncbi:cbb3-type cytochrome oxidase assembly protein [Dongia deserti]|uniref:cbb3-type cytochrome oxidase assembly protein n=1 Tax=Dongia deserti TaxID=2268030 RepID=UPI000E64C38A
MPAEGKSWRRADLKEHPGALVWHRGYIRIAPSRGPLRSGQYDDLDSAASRILFDDDQTAV